MHMTIRLAKEHDAEAISDTLALQRFASLYKDSTRRVIQQSIETKAPLIWLDKALVAVTPPAAAPAVAPAAPALRETRDAMRERLAPAPMPAMAMSNYTGEVIDVA
jgi:hypothetical protein